VKVTGDIARETVRREDNRILAAVLKTGKLLLLIGHL
jgi:hypothetical protein